MPRISDLPYRPFVTIRLATYVLRYSPDRDCVFFLLHTKVSHIPKVLEY